MKLNNWMKRLLALMVMMGLMLTCMPATAFAEETEETEKTEEFVIPADAIYLSDPEDLLTLAENCISDVWSRGKVVVLKNDINLSGTAFEGIPTFGGVFLGQGFTISGLRLTVEQSEKGFFRYLQKTAKVEDLHLKGSVQPVKSGNTDIGGIAGVNSGTVKNCSFTGAVSGNERIGGIAGRNKVSGIIENCTVSGVVFGDHYIGGIAGENLGVIRWCVNEAKVNPNVEHNSVSAIMSNLSIENITLRESVSDATNLGGITGTSSGVIRNCENLANIGYEKMGYNVGGIAGSQIGYITECSNFGIINGSDGVGGIVGQFKPNVVLEFGENPLDAMTGQMSEITDSMNGMMSSMTEMMGSMSGMMGSVSGTLGGLSFDKESLDDAMDMLQNPENVDPDSLNAALNDISKSVDEMYDSLSYMGASMSNQMSGMSGSMDGMAGSMDSMMNTMNEMAGTMETLSNGINIQVIDISREDTEENTLAKVSNCSNHGKVHGETYVGGIAGIADIEDTTAQEEIEGDVTFSTEGEIVMRLVIRDCRNMGVVAATKQYAGGVVGNMTIGAVLNGMNTGNINALNADYVGGIAGSSETYIANSFSRSILAGGTYVGGIAGFGKEVTGCYAITDIAAATKRAGGILGHTELLPDEETGLILDNRYYLTGENLGGIDGICYEGATAPMTIQEFLAVPNLDDMFRTVTVRFAAEDQEDTRLTVALGKSLTVDKIPQLETRESELYHWVLQNSVTAQTLGMGEVAQPQYISEERLTNILFDQIYEAVFDVKNAVIASEEKTETGRALALAVGAFDEGTTLNLTNITGQEAEINGIAVQENWQVSITDIGIEKIHYHIPENVDAEQIALYVQDLSGNWVQRDFTVEGSYMIFAFNHGESGFALEVMPVEEFPVMTIAIGAGVVTILLLLLIITGKRIKKRKAKKGEPLEK